MSDTIRILVATDNHVGAHERDPHRSDDSWKTFHEIMKLSRKHEVDMVLLAGDLFHENKPSRKSMYNVMRSLRLNCLGARPCELEILSDQSTAFDPTFDYVNYEDPDINVSIPVFSIHGNHDDPSGEGHYAALDILAMSGLVNYYGRTPESDSIEVKPVLLQKGTTKLALYGLSNVRDERLYRTFKENKVTFFQAGAQKADWFNLICVHQNHYAHTETNYLPENFLPEFLDLVIWGHEHECLIEPTLNPEMNFHVMQPGSSVATSLVPGEAEPKHVTILSITGREFKSEPIRLTTVRPFIYKEVVLAHDPIAVKIGKAGDHRTKLTAHLIDVVKGMIAEANKQWKESQLEAGLDPNTLERPLPLIRLRVEYTTPDGLSKFQVENPQRFSNRFQGSVANIHDVVQFHIRKRSAAAATAARAAKDAAADKEVMSRLSNLENIRVEKLVKEFLEAQSLQILPTNSFGNAVNDFVDKDDRNALDDFVRTSLEKQIAQLETLRDPDAEDTYNDDEDEENASADLMARIQEIKETLEAEFSASKSNANARNKKRYKPKPVGWDTDEDGEWSAQPAALIRDPSHDNNSLAFDSDDDENGDGTSAPRTTTTASTRGRGRGRGARATTTSRGRGGASARGKATTAAAASKTKSKPTTRGRRTVSSSNDISEDEDSDVQMRDASNNTSNDEDDDEVGDDDEDSQAMFFPSAQSKTASASASASASKRAAAAAAATKAPPATRKIPARAAAAGGGSAKGTGKAAAANASARRTGTGTGTGAGTGTGTGGAKGGRQGTLNFSASQASVLGGRGGGGGRGNGRRQSVESIEDDESDGFEEVSQPVRRRR